MYCENCGAEIKENARFCPKCGHRVAGQKENEQKAAYREQTNHSGQKLKRASRTPGGRRGKVKKWVFILPAVLVLVIAAVIAGILIFRGRQVKEQYESACEEGNRYLEEMDYEKAKASYLEAIDIAPKEKEAYEKLAEVYLQTDEVEEARSIIQEGLKKVPSGDSQELQKKEDEYSTLEEYTWEEEPAVEADDIYYLKDYDYMSYSVNEQDMQKLSAYAVIEKDDRLGLIKNDGTLVTDIKYETISVLTDVLLGNSYLLIPAGYEEGSYGREEEKVYLDETEGKIKPFVVETGTDLGGLEGIFYYCDGLHNIKEAAPDSGYHGELPSAEAIPVKESDFLCTNSNYIWTWVYELPGKYAVYKDGELVTDFIYDNCGSLSSGLMAVEQNGKWGYIDSDGKLVIPMEYDASWEQYTPEGEAGQDGYCYAATEGYVTLVKDGVWEMRNTEGDLVISPGIFEEIRPVYEGKCWVKRNGSWGILTLGDAEETEDTQDGKPEQDDEDETTEEVTSEMYYNLYGPLVDSAYQSYGQYMLYWIYDIDKDGVKELLLQNGTCEADYMYQVYTIRDGTSFYLGEISGFHTGFYADENGGTEDYIIRLVGHMGYESLYHVYIEDNQVMEELISERELGPTEDYYSNPYLIPYAPVTDKSMLK